MTPDSLRTLEASSALPSLAEVAAKAPRENFGVAPLLLPRPIRRHLLAIYAFARFVDDVGDEVSADRLALLDWIESDLERAYAGSAEHPALRQLSPTVRELGLDSEPFLRLIEANRHDQAVVRYASYEELEAYCELSANPVGRLVLAVLGATTPERAAWSDSVCTGLQLAEHWQDVAEDYRRGRVYLPLEDLEQFEVDEAELGGDGTTPALRRLMAFEVERARRLLDEGIPLIRSLTGRGRILIAGYVSGGRAALDAVQRSGYEVLRLSPRAGRLARACALVKTLREASA